jgi:hypothetical protein
MFVNFAYKHLFHAVGIFKLKTWGGGDGFTSPPKEIVPRFLSPLKIYRPRPGLNPRTFGPIASTVTTRSSRVTNSD